MTLKCLDTRKQQDPATLTHKVVVPGTLARCHEEPKEAIRQQHLYFLVVRR